MTIATLSRSVTESKDTDNAPFNPLFYDEENFDYPSDCLKMRDLRLLWPNPEELGEMVNRVRAVEHYCAEGAAVDIDNRAARGQPRPDPKSLLQHPESHNPGREFLKSFYVETGLATGNQAAELLVRGIEERALRQYQPASPPGRR